MSGTQQPLDARQRRLIRELESLLTHTGRLIERFRQTGMDQHLPRDFQHLLTINEQAS